MARAFSYCGVVISVRPSARGNGFPEGLKLIIERCSYYKGSAQRWKLKWNERLRRWGLLLPGRNENLHVYTSVMGFVSQRWTLLIPQADEWFNFRNIGLQRSPAIVSAVKGLSANIGEKEIIKWIKSEYYVVYHCTVHLQNVLIVYIRKEMDDKNIKNTCCKMKVPMFLMGINKDIEHSRHFMLAAIK